MLKVSSTTIFLLEIWREGADPAVPGHGRSLWMALAPPHSVPGTAGPGGAALSKLLLLMQLFPHKVNRCVLWFLLLLPAFTSVTFQNTKKQPRLLLPEETGTK